MMQNNQLLIKNSGIILNEYVDDGEQLMHYFLFTMLKTIPTIRPSMHTDQSASSDKPFFLVLSFSLEYYQ